MPLEIKSTSCAHLPAITAIYSHAVLTGTATFEIVPPQLEEMQRRYRALIDGGYPHLVALLDGIVVGYAYAGPFHTRPAYRFTVENAVYLDTGAHRKGIGTRLMQELIAECEQRDFRLMVAVIGDSANAGSIGLHSRLGFQMVGTHRNVGLKFGRWLDTVHMERPLGLGATTIPAAKK